MVQLLCYGSTVFLVTCISWINENCRLLLNTSTYIILDCMYLLPVQAMKASLSNLFTDVVEFPARYKKNQSVKEFVSETILLTRHVVVY